MGFDNTVCSDSRNIARSVSILPVHRDRVRHSKTTWFNVCQAAKMAGISEALLTLWLETERFVPSIDSPAIPLPDPSHRLYNILSRDYAKSFGKPFVFTQADITRLRKMVEGSAAKRDNAEIKHVKGAHYTVQELATLWGLGVDKIRELFENETGVIKLQKPPRKGRRPYTTLRVPENIAERVQRRNS
jgi:hypothetical protein